MKSTILYHGRYKVAFALILFLFMGMTVQAQTKANEIRMKTGIETITDEVTYNFYDSGGPYIMDPDQDPNNDYNWVTWYQHNESYLLHFTNPLQDQDKGIKIEFNYLLINNDHLKIYEGDLENEEKLIVDLTNNDYSTGYNPSTGKFTVISHGNMTLKFDADYRWRDAGWDALVMLWDYAPQPPVALMQACNNYIELLPGSKALTGETKIYYTLDNNDPQPGDLLSNPIEYTGPFEITSVPTTVKTVLYENGTPSEVATYTFTKLITAPEPPVIVHVPNTNQVTITAPDVPADQNDTYYVRFSLNGTDPVYSSLEAVKDTLIELSEPCIVKAVTRGTTCPEIFSTMVTDTIKTIYVPSPVITFNGDGQIGTATITCSLEGATIYCTDDGTDPTVDPSHQYSGPFSVSAGTTVKAIAYKSGTGYVASPIASAIYIPGNGSAGVFGGVVLLDDREPHSWSYYSDGDQPVHSLKPADVKITYFGYGNNTMTTTDTGDTPTTFDGNVASTAVAVGPNESGNQFIYLKTLEATNPDGSGNYPYTLIPNPFSKRPAVMGEAPVTRPVYLSWGRGGNGGTAASGTIQYSYYDANGSLQTSSTITINGNNTSGYITVQAKIGTTISVTLQKTAGGNNRYVFFSARNDYSNGYEFFRQEHTSGSSADYTSTEVQAPAAEKSYRGFYAWRVKRLSGVTIDGYGVGDIIPAETEIKFVAAANSTNNEVEFEALWAQAYVVTSNTATGLHAGVSYERNFIVGTTAASVGVPVTYSGYYPDGTSAGTASVNGFTCEADTKFEYMTISGGTFTAANHDLIMGRGLTGTASRLRGIGGAATDLDYTIRVESGTYTNFSFVNEQGSGNVSGRYLVKSIMGCDYDRANKDNSKLSVSPNAQLFYSTNVTFGGSGNKDQKTFDCVFKSGSYQSGYWGNNVTNNGDYQHSTYLGQNSAGNTYPGMRFVVVEGGEFGSMNGGRGVGSESETYASPGVVTFDLRIKGGLFHGCVYGAAADNPSIGSRRIVVTGGEIRSWLAGGCNGTGSTSNSGATNGNSFIYVGGNAVIGGSNASEINGTAGGQVFGAGRGLAGRAGSMLVSNVVVADHANISNNVYGGGYNSYIVNTSNVYILGGTIQRNVFGGSYGNGTAIPTTNVFVKGGTITGSAYGGSNSTGTVANSHVTMSGGETTNVFGGGLGASTIIGENTEVTVDRGTLSQKEVAGSNPTIMAGGNVYGGGEEGRVNGSTNVTINGGSMQNVFGAGMGSSSSTANIGGTTKVTVSGGTIAESVYGGGENGNVNQATNPSAKAGEDQPRVINAVSTVEIEGGTIAHNVFGGGSMGFTNGGTVVNMTGGTVEGSVFGGAFGTNGRVYVAGQRTVNMRGGTVNKHVYGGSRNADDALTFNPGTFSGSTAVETASVVNFAGGYVHYQVFASGYFGNVFGSTYAFVGTNAILNAPNHVAGDAPYNEEYYNHHYALRIGGSVWAGGDFGNYDGTKFGDPTITGRSHVYIDGTGYDTESNNTTNTNYMYIGGSIFGSGTSCDAGKQGRYIILREYGKLINASQPTAALPYSSATRALYCIQRADSLVIDNAHVVLLGEGKINSLVTTEKYTIHEFQLVRLANSSSIFLNFPADQIKKFGSYKIENLYSASPTYTTITYETSSLGGTPNKIRVNNGAYLQVKYVDASNNEQYGELEGFAYMMTDDANNTCAYARPKQSTDDGNIIPDDNPNYDNPNDGGFVSYDASLNTYDINGGTVTSGIQMPYENHTSGLTKNGEQYFRIWRAGGKFSYREGVFVAQSHPIAGNVDYYSTTDVTVSLPAFENCDEGTAYYRIKSLDGNTTIDWGTDVMAVNAACYGDPDEAEWMYIDGDNATASFEIDKEQSDCEYLHYIAENPNVNFGLVAIPEDGLAGNDKMLICEASDPKIATMQWTNRNNEKMPKVTFRLTYYNALTNNVVWDPVVITFEQVGCDGKVKAEVDVALTVTTLTNIEQDFVTQAYAIMRGTGSATDAYTAKIVLPQYVMHVNTIGEISKWSCTGVSWAPEQGFGTDCFVGGTNYLSENPANPCNDKFGMTLVAGLNFDNTTGWDSYELTAQDMYGWSDGDYVFGQTTARDPIGFDFTLLYDGRQSFNGNHKLGTLTFTMKFTNYEEAGAEPYTHILNIKIEVWFLGQGANYYIDGVHGNNLYSGRYPNAAKKTLSGVFNRTDYHAGDYIFVVDAITADGNNTLMWNGKAYSEVTLFRYPGGHQCVPNEEGAESHYLDYDIETNGSYQGPLVKVEKDMEMTGIILNGFYKESLKAEGTAAGDIVEAGQEYYHTYQHPTAPLVEILDGGRLSVYGASRMEYNYNSNSNAGGVYIANGGVLNLYDKSSIDTNYVASGFNGGGIYVNSTSVVQLSDEVYITGNCQGLPDSKASVKNNVYLSTYDSHVNVGTADTEDPYNMLLADSRIGVTKNNDWGNYWYAPVAYSDGGQGYLGHLIGSGVITDDQAKYDLVSLNNTHLDPPTDYLYFVGTWVTAVTSKPEGFSATAIDTPEELAWAISVASGYNDQTAAPNTTFTLTGDIDMNANIWVPIGSNGHAYTGTFNGNGHVVTGLRSPMNQENMGMFGSTQGATITDLVAQASFVGGTMKNAGTLIGTMNGGTVSNVEGSGTITGSGNTQNLGGLVGLVQSGTIHSAFAVDTLTGGANTVMGGLVGTNGGDLYNSYSNVTFAEGSTNTGGLVGINTGTVENCYNASEATYAFAYKNQVTVDEVTTKGTINFCYAAPDVTAYVATDAPGTLTGHGNYSAPIGRKVLGYLYDDNKVTLVEGQTNTNVATAVSYENGKIDKWPGMVSALNTWVGTKEGYAKWLRPTSADINGDLPVLCFVKDNSLATEDGKFLFYASNVNANGLDNLFETFAEKESDMFLYGTATDVTKGNGDNMLYINEDAVLLQKEGSKAMETINATVGVTFDNSAPAETAYDYFGNELEYDWHLMSTPLADATFGVSYKTGENLTGYGKPADWDKIENGYFPNMTNGNKADDAVTWDFYTYFEPQYHWINFKRSAENHWHYDDPNDQINYTGTEQNSGKLTAGRGYMMAISQDSYMSNTGALNNDDVTIALTHTASDEGNDPSKDYGWNLVGNPYQAYLDIAQLGKTVYGYDADNGVYAPYVSAASENPAILSQYIHPHQAFFVYTDEGETMTFDYDVMATATSNGTSYFRGGAPVNYPVVNLYVVSQSGNRDLAIVELNRPELGGAYKMEGLRNANFKLYAHYGNDNYSLLFAPEGTQKVPVHFRTMEDGTFTLTWETLHGTFTNLVLVDNLTGQRCNMLTTDHYTFEGSVDDYAARFYITFNATGVDEMDGENGDFAWFDGNEWVVTGQGQLEVIDVTGRVLQSQRVSGEQTRLHLDNVAAGVYVMRLTDGHRAKVQKVVVK